LSALPETADNIVGQLGLKKVSPITDFSGTDAHFAFLADSTNLCANTSSFSNRILTSLKKMGEK
jgi:hypothetical protein